MKIFADQSNIKTEIMSETHQHSVLEKGKILRLLQQAVELFLSLINLSIIFSIKCSV